MIKAQRNTPGNFEAELRNNMLMNKLRADVTAGAFVPEAEVRDLFRYEGERRILEYVFYPLEDYTSKVTVDDAQTSRAGRGPRCYYKELDLPFAQHFHLWGLYRFFLSAHARTAE